MAVPLPSLVLSVVHRIIYQLPYPCPAPCPAETGLAVLRHLPLLRDLSLRGCQQLADGCLVHLAGLSRLQRLDMRACEHLRGEALRCGSSSPAQHLMHLPCHPGCPSQAWMLLPPPILACPKLPACAPLALLPNPHPPLLQAWASPSCRGCSS